MKNLMCYQCGGIFPISDDEWKELGLEGMNDYPVGGGRGHGMGVKKGVSSMGRPFCNTCSKENRVKKGGIK